MMRPVEQSARVGIDFDAYAARGIVCVRPAAFGDPLTKQGIGGVVPGELQSAAVGELHLRLVKQQASVGIERIGPAAKVFAYQRELVESRIERSQRKTKAAFAARRTVAGPAVTALL